MEEMTFEDLKRKFFKDYSYLQRLQILKSVGAVMQSFFELVSHSQELTLLEHAFNTGKANDIILEMQNIDTCK